MLIGEDALRRHPSQRAATVLCGPPDGLWPVLETEDAPPDPAWREGWAELQAVIDDCFSHELASPTWNEPAILRALAQHDQVTTMVVSSSMPIRDLEWFGGARSSPPVVHANRGANGIDGIISTAIGVALAGCGPVVGVLGDLAFLHDVSALVEGLGGSDASLALVVLDNGGGGIFSFLPQRASVDPETFRELFATKRTPSPATVAAGFGLSVDVVSDATQLMTALQRALSTSGLRVIVCELQDHDANVACHTWLVAAAQDAATPVVLR